MKFSRFIVLAGVLAAGHAFATHPLPPINLVQQTPSGTPVPAGGTISGTSIQLTASSDGNSFGGSAGDYKLEIEVRPISTAFTGVPTHTVALPVVKNTTTQYPWITVTGLSGAYHWQARENVLGALSSWVQFNAGNTAFTAAGATVSPTTVSFGTVRVGTPSAPQTVTFSNSGSNAVTINSSSITGPFSLSSGPTLPATVAPNGSVQFGIVATPTATGPATGTLSFTSTATNSPHTVSLSVSGGFPSIGLSPTSVNFGDQGINANTATQTVVVRNSGNAPLTIFSGTVAAPFSVAGLSGLVVPAGGSRTFTVGFAPTVQGPATGTLIIDSDDPGTPTSLPLSGIGVAPHLTLSQSTLAFTDTLVGATTVSSSITLTNTGTGTLHVAAPVVPTGFTTTLAAQSVAQGASITFTVTFAPTSPGPVSANLTIPSDDANGPALIALSGTARAPGLTVAPTSVSFGSVSLGASQTALLTLSNPGDATLTITALNLSGAVASDFSLQGAPTLPLTIAAGGSTQLTVKFTPSNVGSRTASLGIVSNRYPAGTLSIPLSGMGDGPVIALSPTSLNFGQANLNGTNTRTFNVANSGTAALVVSGLTFSTGAAVDFNTTQSTPFTVNPGSSNTVTLTFKPTQVGIRTSKVTVASNDPINPGVDVTLTGEGVAPNIYADPLSLDFAQVRVGQTQQRTISIQNFGTGPLTLNGFMFVGDDAARFSVNGINAPYTLQPGAPAVQLNVTFNPTSVGIATASLVIASDDPDSGSLQIPVMGEGIAPNVAFSATSLNFGGQVVNRPSMPRTVDITNTGTGPLQVFSLSILGAASTAYSVIEPSTPFTVQPGGKATVKIVLSPKTVGEQSARLIVQSDAPAGANAHVDLLGLGISEVFTVTPATIDFGTVKVGQSSSAVVVTLQNQSGDTLPLGSPVLGGPDAGNFKATLMGTSVAPGGSVTAMVTYMPTAAGAHAATLSLGSTDPQVPIAQVMLNGNSVSRLLDGFPATFDFGQVPVGQSSQPQLFTVTNKTNKPINITAINSSSPEFQVDPSGLGTVEAGKTRNISVTFTPADVHLAIASLAISVEGQQQGQAELTFAVSGTGTAPEAKSGCSAAGGTLGLWSLIAVAGTSLLRRRRP